MVAALDPKLDETAAYGGQTYLLYADRRAGGRVMPQGFVHMERFFLEGTTPVWRYALGDAILEKRVWMQQGAKRLLPLVSPEGRRDTASPRVTPLVIIMEESR